MLGLRIGRRDAEDARRRLTSAGLIDRSREIAEEEGHAVIPLTGSPPDGLLSGIDHRVVDRDFKLRRTREDPIDEIRRMAEVPDELRHTLPSKWELVGDVLVIRLPPQLEGFKREAAEAYARVLGAKSVLQDVGGITGELRTPSVERIIGDSAVTVHKENGVLFKLDLEKVMFSSGNVDERVRVSRLECDGEVVVDMFAGIGYFSLPMAVHRRPERVVSCEMNPVAFQYLAENVRLNGVEDTVEPVRGDNRVLRGSSFADRVLMGYVKTTHEFLGTAFRVLRSGGVVHYHETCPCDLLPDRPVQRLASALPDGRVDVLGVREVKSYSPGISHVVVDARVLKND
ncbi:MAG: class I SAM-dependent methyltransferase family protein [Methanobacteriota archaeon]|nr:MAG: class I SAM-dependent methyltransferase family protein [Euryarchaeota archaeon]